MFFCMRVFSFVSLCAFVRVCVWYVSVCLRMFVSSCANVCGGVQVCVCACLCTCLCTSVPVC